MISKHSTRALIELMQIGKPPSSADPVLHHAPEAFHRMEVVSAMRRQEMQPKLLVPVRQCRRELVRPVDATAIGDHDNLFLGVAKDGHHLMDVLAQPLRLNMGDPLIEDFRGPILDRADDAEQHAPGDAAPRAIRHPRLAFEAFCAFDLALAQGTYREASAVGFPPPAGPGEGKAPQDGLIFIQQNDLAPASTVCQGGEFERGIREGRRLGIEPPGRPTVAYGLFFNASRTLSRLTCTPVWRAKTAASS